MKESAVLHRVMLALTSIGCRLGRNNTGQAWMGNATELKDGTVLIHNPRRVRFGVFGNGGADLIGWTPYTVKPSDVGREIPVFSAVEVKQPGGRVSMEQQSFLSAVEAAGGVSVVAYEAEAAVAEVMRKTHQLLKT